MPRGRNPHGPRSSRPTGPSAAADPSTSSPPSPPSALSSRSTHRTKHLGRTGRMLVPRSANPGTHGDVDKLRAYRDKRDPARTPEPVAEPVSGAAADSQNPGGNTLVIPEQHA